MRSGTGAGEASAAEQPTVMPKHFHSLDVLRGLAALSVVFAHWHILFSHGEPVEPRPETMPLSSVFFPFYAEGWRAVDLFFCLSGFIFYWLYAAPIRDRRISLFKFGVLRLSRLYPLHFATLLIVALGQYLFYRSTGTFFFYKVNDAWHFVLNLFFVQHWVNRPPLSFNGPSWSISVEVGLYLVFFMLCRLGFIRWWLWVGLIALAMVLRPLEVLQNDWYRGLAGFFMGCLTFLLFHRMHLMRLPRAVLVGIVALTLLLWAGAALPMNEEHPLVRLVTFVVRSVGGRVADRVQRDPEFIVRVAANLYFNFGVFPMTVLTLALVEARRGTLGKRLAFVGDLSYASYLLHFPLMLGIMLFFVNAGISHRVFYSPLAMLAFFGVLVGVSTLCYRVFEKPAQDAIRTAILGTRKIAKPPAK